MSSSADAPDVAVPVRFRDLSISSVRALRYADAMRRKTDQSRVHMEHLVMGLYVKQDGPAERLFRAHGIGSSGALRDVLLQAAEVRVPETTIEEAADLEDWPPLSKHVLEALGHARAIADRMHSTQVQSRHLLYGILTVTDCQVVKVLLARGISRDEIPLTITTVVDETGTPIVGAASDAPSGVDRLNLDLEIKALSALVASRDTKTPMSIGLFGNWGSGKSFFMQKMDAQIREFGKDAQADPASPYCAGIVQLWFNAWHYIDKSLWASLGAEIFEGLAHGLTEAEAQVSGRSQLEDARTDLMMRKAEAESERKSAQAAVRESEGTLAEHQNTITELQTRTDSDIERAIGTKAIVDEVLKAAAAQPEVRQALDDAAAALDLPALNQQAERAGAQVKEILATASFGQSVVTTVKRRGSAKRWIVVVLLAGASIPLSGWLLTLVPHLQSTARWLLSALTAFAVAAAPVLLVAGRVTSLVRAASTGLQRRIDAEREAALAAAEQQRAAAAREVAAKRETLDASNEKVVALETEIQKLQPDRQFSDFIRLRHQSTDYTKHFGVIARARQDFEELTRLMQLVRNQQSTAAPGTPSFRMVDRIVLYIDDLDRCPEHKVFEVLQAVHLLLAFPLFVVVVGVDPRWLFHSLRTELAAFSDRPDSDGVDEDERLRWQSTPLNYLEKIFQIPFTLRPMQDTGFEKLVDDLVTPSETDAHGKVGPPPPQDTGANKGDRTAPQGAGQGQAGAQGTTGDTTQTGAGKTAAVADRKAAHERLTLTEWEVAHMKLFFALIPSPRATKRFVNVYRLLRGVLPAHERSNLVGSAGYGGYKSALLLLAMLTGYPAEATDVIRELMDRAVRPDAPDNWWDMLDVIRADAKGKAAKRPPAPARRRAAAPRTKQNGTAHPEPDDVLAEEMYDKLTEIREKVGDYLAVEDVVEWAPVVARYSFASGRLLVAESR